MKTGVVSCLLACGCLVHFGSKSLAQTTNLAQALDATNLVWTTGGNSNWFGQTDITKDGVDAGQSGHILTNQESWVQTTVTGPGTLSFWWRVIAWYGLDFLQFYIDGQYQAQISGDNNSGDVGWKYGAYTIPDGSHTLRWRYVKGTHVGNVWPDAGFLDQVIFTTVPPLPLGLALDTCGVAWTNNGGNNNPTYWAGQTNVTHDGIDAAQSGAITDSQETWMAATVSGVTNVSFWWKVSSEPGFDYLEFYNDATLLTNISGEVNWVSNSFSISPSTHTLKWRYYKDDSNTAGQDKGWVDQITFKPPLPCSAESFSLSSPGLTNGSVQFSVLIGDEFSCQVQYSTNLPSTNWFTLTNFPANSVKVVVDPSATNSAQRFYRGVSTNSAQ